MKKILKLITPLLATLFLLTACSSEKQKYILQLLEMVKKMKQLLFIKEMS